MIHSSLSELVQPEAGFLSCVTRLPAHPGDPRFTTMTASLGEIGYISEPLAYSTRTSPGLTQISGAGGGLSDEDANIRAIAEALERYSSCIYDKRQFIWASANELGSQALDLDTVPRCSAAELAHPKCPVIAPLKDAPIRWVDGISLHTGKVVKVPAIMVFLHIPYMSYAERMWLPISTGCAAHTSYDRALLGAILELVERDAISVTWLQRMALPRIDIDCFPGDLRSFWERYENSSTGIEHIFFDATGDLGLPTVYGLQLSRENSSLATLAMCSTELDPATAVAKILRESASSRIPLQMEREQPGHWDDFFDVMHGAAYMGKRERLPAFDFLMESTASRKLSEMAAVSTGDDRRNLQNTLEILRRRGMEAIAVDLTTDEALRAGVRVVRVIIPALQPLSFHYRARFLGHARLYDAPARAGYQVHQEQDLNPWPQPFA